MSPKRGGVCNPAAYVLGEALKGVHGFIVRTDWICLVRNAHPTGIPISFGCWSAMFAKLECKACHSGIRLVVGVQGLPNLECKVYLANQGIIGKASLALQSD